MRELLAVFKRELAGYFITPVAYVFILVFLVATGWFTFAIGNFFERDQADLLSFFAFHPWLYLFLVPTVSGRLWAEERRSGTIELLMTLPIPQWALVVGKFLAAWAFIGVALVLTFPVWITVNLLGEPDNGVILMSYVASFLMAGGFLAVGACISATTKSQVIAIVLSAVACFALLMAGIEGVQQFFDWAPLFVREMIAGLSFLTRFGDISRGVISASDIVFFLTLIALALAANGIVLELKKAS